MTSRPSVVLRLLLLIVPVAISGILLIGVSAYFTTKQFIVRTVVKDVHELGFEAAQNISSYLSQRSNDLETISETPLFSDYYSNQEFQLVQEAETYRTAIEEFLARFSRRTRAYNAIYYLDAAGRALCSIEFSRITRPPAAFPAPELKSAFASLAPGKEFLSPPAQDARLGPTAFYARGMFGAAGERKGTLVLACDMSPVLDIIRRLRGSSSGWAFLADADGAPLAPGLWPESAPADGDPSLFRHGSKIPGTLWTLGIVVDLDNFLDPLDRIRFITAASVLFCAALVFFLIHRILHRSLDPMRQLMAATRRLSAGHLDERVSIRSRDEFGDLSQAFNAMAEEIQRRAHDLVSHLDQLRSLQETGNMLLDNRNPEDIFRLSLRSAVRGLGFEKGMIFRVGEDIHDVEETFAYGAPDAEVAVAGQRGEVLFRLAEDDPRLSVMRRREPDCVSHAHGAARFRAHQFWRELGLETFCLMPIQSQERVFGVMIIGFGKRDEPMNSIQRHNLALLCNAIGLALGSSDLFRKIQQSEDRYRTTVESSLDAIVGLDASLRVTTWNIAAQNLFEFGPGEMLGREITRLFQPDAARRLIEDITRDGYLRNYEVQGLTRTGRPIELSLTWAGSPRDGGASREWSVVMRDVTEQKKLHAQLLHAEKLSAVGQLISGVAHEINNPLAAVVGYAELLAQEKEASGLHADLKAIYQNAIRCRDIVSNLLRFSRKAPLKKSLLSVSDVVTSALTLMEYKLAKTEAIRLRLQLSPDTPPIEGDFQTLEQVIVNLTTNACDAMQGMNGPKEIAVTTFSSDGWVILRFQDNGPGIPDEVRGRIFEPFFTTKEEGRGTGLGLTISQDIIRTHGGTIQVDRPVTGGTAFVIRLPAARRARPDAEAPARMPPAVPNKRVLVIDDEADLLPLMEKVLVEDGDLVQMAASGPEGLEKLRRGKFDLVISDVEMGAVSGKDILREIQSMEARPSLIFVTGDLLNVKVTELINTVKVPFISKPFSISDFRANVRRVLAEGSVP